MHTELAAGEAKIKPRTAARASYCCSRCSGNAVTDAPKNITKPMKAMRRRNLTSGRRTCPRAAASCRLNDAVTSGRSLGRTLAAPMASSNGSAVSRKGPRQPNTSVSSSSGSGNDGDARRDTHGVAAEHARALDAGVVVADDHDREIHERGRTQTLQQSRPDQRGKVRCGHREQPADAEDDQARHDDGSPAVAIGRHPDDRCHEQSGRVSRHEDEYAGRVG